VVGAFVLGHQPVWEQISCLVITGLVVMGLSTIMSWLEGNWSFFASHIPNGPDTFAMDE
jgi:hypothetical protein